MSCTRLICPTVPASVGWDMWDSLKPRISAGFRGTVPVLVPAAWDKLGQGTERSKRDIRDMVGQAGQATGSSARGLGKRRNSSVGRCSARGRPSIPRCPWDRLEAAAYRPLSNSHSPGSEVEVCARPAVIAPRVHLGVEPLHVALRIDGRVPGRTRVGVHSINVSIAKIICVQVVAVSRLPIISVTRLSYGIAGDV
jgi:hypothetical protein